MKNKLAISPLHLCMEELEVVDFYRVDEHENEVGKTSPQTSHNC